MRGNTFQRFREKITELCDCVDVHPFPGKGHFEDVQQEIAFQFFWKKATQSKAPGTINFHGDVTTSLYELNSPVLDDFPTRVGALVWNRTTHRFAARSTSTQPTLVIYGGNIQSNKSRLVLDHGRYANRQWMITTPNPTDFFHGPGILLRRTVRGRPAAWQVDAVAVGVGFKAILENHVVSICVPRSWKVQQTKLFCNLFVECVQDIHAPSGSATLNQTEVRAAILGAKKVLDLIFGHKVDSSSPIKSPRLAGTPLDMAVGVGRFAGRVRKPVSIAELDAAIEVDAMGRMR